MPRRKPPTSAVRSARVACYARVSTEDQGERQTIQSQLDFLRKYVDLHQIDAADFYVDDGVSGTIPLGDRPDGARMLADARDGRFGAVLVYRLDRLGRNLRALLDSHDELDQANVSIRSATEPFDTATPIGQFLFQLLGSLAELERTTILERMTLGRDRVARAGKWTTGWLPAGYDLDADGCLTPSERLLPDGTTEADMVREVFRRIAGGATLVSEARRLEALGVPCVKRRPPAPDNVRQRWWPTTLHKIIRHTVYQGTYTLRSRNGPVEIPVPALVTPELWAAAGVAMTRNRDLSSIPGTRTYALRGLVRCRTVLADGSVCGRTYVGGSGSEPGPDGQRPLYYHCSGLRSHHNTPDRAKCFARSIPVAVLDDAVWADVRAFVLDPSAVFADARAHLLSEQDGQAGREHEREKLRRSLAAHQDERDRAMLLFRKRLATIEETERILTGLDAAIASATALLASIDSERSASDTVSRHLEDAARLLAGLHEYVARGDDGDQQARRIVLDMLVREVSLSTEREARPRGRTRKNLRVRIRYVFSPNGDGRESDSIVSALAHGIDTHAHRAALAAGGRTIAVLGSGLDRVYPTVNKPLAEQIAQSGAVISEYPLGTPPDGQHFPRRNRIVAGLSKAILVVEADFKSGAMITATQAAEQGRDVFAVPGSIFSPMSAGPHQLIREGAKVVTEASDILEELHLTAVVEQQATRAALPSDPTEAAILKLLSDEPTHVDDVTRAAGLPSSVVTSTLTIMELKGLARQFGHMQYVRA